MTAEKTSLWNVLEQVFGVIFTKLGGVRDFGKEVLGTGGKLEWSPFYAADHLE